MAMKQRTYIALSGFLWIASGTFLLYKGLHFINEATHSQDSLCYRWQTFFGSPQQAATILMGIGLLVGYLKSRFVLSKTVRRVSSRIASLSEPIRFVDAYSKSYWILIAAMVGLGVSFRFLPISVDLRGMIDVAIGSALVNGAMLFFRAARAFQVPVCK